MPFSTNYNDTIVFYVPELDMKHVSHLYVVSVNGFDLEITLKWLLLISNDLQFYLYCYNWVPRPQNRYKTCVTLIFSNTLKSQKFE